MSELFPVDSRKKFSVPINPPVDDPSLYAKPKPAIFNYSNQLIIYIIKVTLIILNLSSVDMVMQKKVLSREVKFELLRIDCTSKK